MRTCTTTCRYLRVYSVESSVTIITVVITVNVDSSLMTLQEVQLRTVEITVVGLNGASDVVPGSVSFSIYVGITIYTGNFGLLADNWCYVFYSCIA